MRMGNAIGMTAPASSSVISARRHVLLDTRAADQAMTEALPERPAVDRCVAERTTMLVNRHWPAHGSLPVLGAGGSPAAIGGLETQKPAGAGSRRLALFRAASPVILLRTPVTTRQRLGLVAS
jgi:hypothetical protein